MNETNAGKSVLVVYGSRFGHSHAIAVRVGKGLREQGFDVKVADAHRLGRLEGPTPGLDGFAGIVLVASVQYGYIDPAATRWVTRNLRTLASLPTLLVTVSLTARKYVDALPEDISEHVYTRKFLERTGWQPTMIELAAGRLEYPRYNVFDRKMIQLIMHISHGVTDGTSTIEYTNWDRIDTVAADFGQAVEG